MRKLYQAYCRHSLWELHFAVLVVAGCLYFATIITHDAAFARYGYRLFVLDIFSWLIHRNQQGIYQYLTMNRDVSFVPKQRIRLLNTLLLAAFLLATGGFMYLLLHLPWQNVWHTIKEYLGAALRLILSHIFPENSGFSPQDVLEEEVSLPQAGAFAAAAPSGGPSFLGQLLEHLAVLITVVFLLWLIFFLFRSLLRKLTSVRRKEGVDVREFVSPKMAKERTEKKQASGHIPFFDRSPEGRIRKLYIRSVRRHMSSRQTPARSMTPSQIEDLAGLTGFPGQKELHEAYEKARYSNETFTGADVDKARRGAAALK